jgi:hypothetical protein
MSMSMAFEYDWAGATPGGWGDFRGWLQRFEVAAGGNAIIFHAPLHHSLISDSPISIQNKQGARL